LEFESEPALEQNNSGVTMTRSAIEQPAQCGCGTSKFAVHGAPIIRAYCHCQICQAFNNGPYADITILLAKDVTMIDDTSIAYNTYSAPPAVQRGKCEACGHVAIEFLRLFPLPKLAIIPSVNFSDCTSLPEPSLHIFYHRRVADMPDSLPKYSGYLRSQLVFAQRLLSSMVFS